MGEQNPEIIRMAKDFKEKAEVKYGIKKVILFGSQATGKAKPESDIDLMIVSDKIKNKPDFMSKLYSEWHLVQKKNYPVDFVCFTKKEFNKLSKKITIVKQALEEGVAV